MSSDSSTSDKRPSDAKLESALREAVQDVYKTGNLEELTIRRIRKTVEEWLGLDEGFFKTDAVWKDQSKVVVQLEVVRISPHTILIL